MHDNINYGKKKIIFSDKAHFHLDAYINKQNYRICGSENRHVILQKPMQSLLLTVWYGLWSEGIIGPYFLNNEDGTTMTAYGDTYRTI